MTRSDRERTLANFRDLGGVRTKDGSEVPYGILYRSDAPQEDDRAPMGTGIWPARTVIDLRADDERARRHALDTARTVVHHLSMDIMLAPDALSRQHVDELDLAARYLLLLSSGQKQMARIVEIVADSEPPLLVHCVAGKDRTGIVIALLLRAVGVSTETVMDDYLQTNGNLRNLRTRMTQSGIELPSDPALLAVQPLALTGVLENVESSGTVGDWLHKAGVDTGTLTRLRNKLTGR